jgi:hypothetical protein
MERNRSLHIHLSPLERTRLWVEILAFLAAGVWGVYTFVYQTSIAPLFDQAHEIVAVSLTPIAVTRGANAERVQVTLHNDGRVAVDYAGFAANLYGLSDLRQDRAFNKKLHNVLVSEGSAVANHWQLASSYGELFTASLGGPKGKHLILNPGDSVGLEYPSIVPRGRYLALKLNLAVSFVRYPNNVAVPLQLVRGPDGAYSLEVDRATPGADNALGVNNDWYFPI